MSSNYPPGVTGHEYQIAGPDSDSTFYDAREIHCENEECSDYDNYREETVLVGQWIYGDMANEEWEWTCPICKTVGKFENEYELESEDPDRLHDEMGEW
jgi:hypothetical protein